MATIDTEMEIANRSSMLLDEFVQQPSHEYAPPRRNRNNAPFTGHQQVVPDHLKSNTGSNYLASQRYNRRS